MKKAYKVKNREHINAYLHHSIVSVNDGCEHQHFGNDRILLFIPDYAENDTDLIFGDDLIMSFSKSDALSLARKLISMAHKLKTGEQREIEGLNGTPIFPIDELNKTWE